MIRTKLRSHYLPDELERKELAGKVEELERTLFLESSKGNSDGEGDFKLSPLHEHTAFLEQSTLHLRAFLAPIRRLPAETLAEIYHFVLAFAHEWFLRPSEQLNPTRALIKLSHVCFFWRETCLSTSTLWSDIRMPSLFCGVGSVRLVEMHLSRSRSAALDIQIHNSAPFGRDLNLDGARTISKNLILHRERWKRLWVIGDRTLEEFNSIFQQIVNSSETLRFPHLELLQLEDTEDEIHVFSAAEFPRLRKMAISTFTPGLFPFQQLTSLSLLHSLHRFPRTVEKYFANLEELQITGQFSYLPVETGDLPVPVVLPKLKSLGLELYEKSSMILPFSTFNLPALLSLEICAPLYDWPQVEFISMLIRSQLTSSLRTLSLRWTRMKDEQLLETLRLTPNLEDLKVVDDRLNSTLSLSFFQTMTIRPGDTEEGNVIVPKLQSITFSMALPDRGRFVGYEMVASRASEFLQVHCPTLNCRPLESVTLILSIGYPPFASLTRADIQSLRESMDVKVIVYPANEPHNQEIL